MSKLKVGQRIGIYEVVKDENPSEAVYEIGSQHLGEPTYHSKRGDEVDLFDKDSIHGIGFTYSLREVRKVGTLIVKKVK